MRSFHHSSADHARGPNRSPKKLGGKPVFRGTRIPISYLAQYLGDGYTVEDFIEVYDIDPNLVHQVYEERFKDDEERGETTTA